ncbi:MBOAT, membrane-bound O-acyltransferase family-domain-containing protein [Spinellus fusiger]|nr:MBOAT, membrane-bound O-acyltransferase family-domain-containing protein [Spinellus fusiger]
MTTDFPTKATSPGNSREKHKEIPLHTTTTHNNTATAPTTAIEKDLLMTMPTPNKGHERVAQCPLALWNTKEFYLYYLAFASVVPYMFYTTYRLGREDAPNYPMYSSMLSEGWMFGRKLDNTDDQYAQFRQHLPILSLLVFVYLCASQLWSHYAGTQISRRLRFSLTASLVAITIFHGTSILKILAIISTSYAIGKCTGGSRWNPVLTWGFNLLALFMNEWYKGYSFASLESRLAWMMACSIQFTMLRLISFNMDYYWQFQKSRVEYEKKEDLPLHPLSDKERVTLPCHVSEYNYMYFLAYVLYTPLYLCGPIITFNDFISQIREPSHYLSRRSTFLYTLRLVGVILIMEWILHHLYVVAISKSQAWVGNSPLELSMIGYFNLTIIWMKLLIPWRFFRLWAMADGIWTGENMVRCMSNNFSAQRFWKSWHRTFNRWTVRYIYIPLGGSKYMAFNMWIVFTFVALWHDIKLNLLAWGWLICIFLAPELLATYFFSYKTFGQKPYYRFVCGVGAVANIIMMMIANLVGFCLGLEGMKHMILEIFGTVQGLIYLVSASVCIFICSQIQFEIREEEKRKGNSQWIM